MKSKQIQSNRTGIYLRLSKDDERAGESISIENQRQMLTKYVEEKGWKIAGEYVDDGYTGTNFDRPEVQRLIDDVHMGRLDIVIVKDLSRFGRNYIEVGRYIDYEFPLYNIRFIALSDNIDTADKNSTAMDMMPIMNVFNEWHCANTSKKIRAVKESNAKTGKYAASIAAYGYVIGDGENRLPVVDPEAAEIVKRIFEMRARGMGYRKIAADLTVDGIPVPSDYRAKRFNKEQYGIQNGFHRWHGSIVKQMLNNPIYLGHLTQMRKTTVSYKNKKQVLRDEDEWVTVKNTHEPIISQELWDKCKEIEKSHTCAKGLKSGIILPLAGLLYCPDCGGKIKYGFTDNKKKDGSIRRVSFYNCGTYTRVGKYACSSHWIGHNELQEIVLNDIRAKANLVIDDEKREREEFMRRKQQSASVKVGAEKKRLLADKKRLTELEKLIQSVYEDKVSGKIPEEICISLMEKYLEEKKTLSARVSESETILTENEKNTADVDEFIRRLKKYASAEELTREMCIELIERITIGKVVKDKTAEREIHIYYKFMDNGYSEKLHTN